MMNLKTILIQILSPLMLHPKYNFYYKKKKYSHRKVKYPKLKALTQFNYLIHLNKNYKNLNSIILKKSIKTIYIKIQIKN